MSEKKDKINCLEKAKMIFNTVIILNKNTPDDETNRKFNKICKDLTILCSMPSRDSPKKKFSMEAFRFTKKKVSSQRLIENNIGKNAIFSDFDNRVAIIEAALSEFYETSKHSTLCEDLCEETRIAQTGTALATRTQECLRNIKKLINPNEINKNAVSEVLKEFRALNSTIEKLIKEIEQSSSCQEMKLFYEKIKHISIGLYKLTHLIDLNLETFSEIENFNSVPVTQVVDTLKEINSEYLKIEHCLSSLLENRVSKRRNEESHFSSLFFLLSTFFQFTEENYFQIFQHKHKKLAEIIAQTEKIYEPQSTLLDKHSAILATYINMLVQKHPFILEQEKIQENDQKVKSNCLRYNFIHKEDVPNAKKIDAILKFNSGDRKIKTDKIGLLSGSTLSLNTFAINSNMTINPHNFNIKSDLITPKNSKSSNGDFHREKFRNLMKKNINLIQEKNLDITVLLEDSKKK
ncbi:MAG: hypothetical protein H0T62_11940 [Parachlamydiaceae bacterium]|nr:hypothetical protein [Parachlamydiaceae bacterium]